MSARAGVAAIAVLAGAMATVARAQSVDDEGYPLRLEVGDSIAICATGAVICPVGVIQCDDPGIVKLGGDARGPIVTGARPGTTLCSAGSAGGAGVRRVFRVTVVPKPKP